MMKRMMSVLVVLTSTVVLGTGAIAASYPQHLASVYPGFSDPLIISPRYSYTQTITAALNFNDGKANCSGAVKPSGNYNCSIKVTLYKQNGSNWDYITSWSGSGTNGNEAAAGGSKSVGSGTYKVVASANVGGKEFPSKSVTRTKN